MTNQRTNFGLVAVAALLLIFAGSAQAHVGSPDVFFDGMVGPYPARITIRVPQVVPGRAEIVVRLATNQTAEVSFRPLFSQIAVSNAPPPDVGRPVPGEAGLYDGDLWLMSFGSYSIEVSIRGAAGAGTVDIPVNSVALRQLPLPPYLGGILLVLAAVLVIGGWGIVVGAARDSELAPGMLPGRSERRKARWAGAITALVFAVALAGGRHWWRLDERAFASNLASWTHVQLTPSVRVENSQRILRLDIGREGFGAENFLRLIPDHGKLIHLFLVKLPGRDAFGHVHPVRKGNHEFEVLLPPLPAGDYEVFCDMTFENSLLSLTATNVVRLPPAPEPAPATNSATPDPDDSWAAGLSPAPAGVDGGEATCRLPDGLQVLWKSHPPLEIRKDAGLNFEVRDAAGNPEPLEPYMGMMSHVAVLRADGTVFAHLHPSGNYSMAAQMFFDQKRERELDAAAANPDAMPPMDHAKMHHHHPGAAPSAFSLPYEFPTSGNYRLWVQFKAEGRIETAIFDTTVAE